MKRTHNKIPEIGRPPNPGQSIPTPAERLLALASRRLPERIALEEVQDAREHYEENTRQGKRARLIYRDLLKDLASACGNTMRMLSTMAFKEALREFFRQIAS